MTYRLASIGFLAAALLSFVPANSHAQSAPMDPDLAVPMTRLLATGSFTAKATPGLWGQAGQMESQFIPLNPMRTLLAEPQR